MTVFLEIIKYILPSLVILAVVYIMLRLFFKGEHAKQSAELKLQNRKTIAPLQLQAYERVVLFLERITPANLITREFRPEMKAAEFRADLLKTIRQEYEHNMSQQLYVSSSGWEMVKNAKEGMIRIINEAGSRLKEDANAADLSEKIFELYLKQNKVLTDVALEQIKEEMRSNF